MEKGYPEPVGISCKACGVFLGVNALSKDGKVVVVGSAAMLLDHCLVCESEAGFVPVTHAEYHETYLNEGEQCSYCQYKVALSQEAQQ